MAEPTVTPAGDGFRVLCAEHGLDRTVETERHATNLLNLHLRKDHPVTPPDGIPDALNVTAFAQWVVLLHGDGLLGGPYRGAIGAWCEATGAPDDETGLAWARQIAETRPPVHAAIPPF